MEDAHWQVLERSTVRVRLDGHNGLQGNYYRVRDGIGMKVFPFFGKAECRSSECILLDVLSRELRMDKSEYDSKVKSIKYSNLRKQLMMIT